MPGEELFTDGSGKALSALLFQSAYISTMDVYSAVNSSPWTAESFGGDPHKANRCREYVMHAIVNGTAIALLVAWIARSWWPLIGMAVANLYMYWLYNRALSRAQLSGSTSWSQKGV